MQRFSPRFAAARVLPLAALTLAVSSAFAAPVVGPQDATFYNAPLSLAGGTHGDLISYRTTTVALGTGAPTVKAWTVMYKSTDSNGNTNAVTGTVIVPTTGGSLFTARPVISYAVGTHGLAQGCAPSAQLKAGTDYETANIVAALKAGYAVLVSDNAGYTSGATPTYLAGQSQGHAALDIVRAASQIPFGGVSANAKIGLWGYSQGGQTAAWAAQQKAVYAPKLNVVGVAAGGIPADFLRTAAYLDGSAGSSFLLAGVVGLSQEYPTQIPINELTNDAGKQTIARGKTECVFEALFDLMNHRIAEYTVGNKPLSELVQVPAINQTLRAQNLGEGQIPMPLYQYHGIADEFIPIDQTLVLKKQYCSKFTDVTFDLYPSEHIATQFQAAPYVLSWMADRMAGKASQGTCNSTLPDPISTANPSGGNFIVSLKNWPLKATVDLKTLKQTVIMPAASSFSADTDLTAKRLSGNLNVPDFKQSISVIGIPAQVGLKITPVGATTGDVSLDKNGQLTVTGTAYADITVTSVLGIPFGECKTVTPVAFPLNFKGPISSLGNGGLTFTGSTTFPQIKGCSISAVLSTMMSGTGQNFTFNVSPPAPTRY
jgi:pimeloyl-ACP methyl ester carboxylesterase